MAFLRRKNPLEPLESHLHAFSATLFIPASQAVQLPDRGSKTKQTREWTCLSPEVLIVDNATWRG